MTSTVVDQSADSIVNGPKGSPIDVMQTIDQIGLDVRMQIGYVVSSLMYAEDYIKFQISLDRRPRRWVIVKLDRSDTYSIEVGRLQKKFYWTIDKQLEGVYAEQLGEVIKRLFVEVYS
jgi:hypothetical protein